MRTLTTKLVSDPVDIFLITHERTTQFLNGAMFWKILWRQLMNSNFKLLVTQRGRQQCCL